MTMETGPQPKYKPGQPVCVDDRAPLGHCRAPLFIRGHVGEVALIHGAFRDPERLAYHQPGLPPQVLYKVRFRQTDLWTDYAGNPADQLEVDVYENWLKPAAS
ncbi:MAG: nitrile hydratase subunit beta [Hyphomicrobiaceae bacterium]